jgi:mannan polymerase II complex MNN10 subunit
MSLSRSPSPNEDGGWSSPGLTTNYVDTSGRASPVNGLRGANASSNNVTWDGARKKSSKVNGGYPSFSTQHNGFFSRHMRNISASLPKFVITPDDSKYAEKEKLGRGRWMPNRSSKLGRLANFSINTFQKFRLRFLIVFGLIFATILFYTTRKLL